MSDLCPHCEGEMDDFGGVHLRDCPLAHAAPQPQVREKQLEEALKKADRALSKARDGLDLGLGCARQLDGDMSPVPLTERTRRGERYLEEARKAHREVQAALEGKETS
jgi:hypothetical protein